MRAYYYDDVEGDQRLPHDSGISVSDDELKQLGLITWTVSDNDEVERFAKERRYVNRDEITVSKKGLGDAYESKIKMFFEEHMHDDEEIRWAVDGAGYFDIRDKTDAKWIRIRMEKNDLLVLPPGIYHRFTLDTGDYIKATRLFREEPKWIAQPRSKETDANSFRQEYTAQRASVAAH